MAARLAMNATPGLGVALSKRILNTKTSHELVKESLDRITFQSSRVPMELVDSFMRIAELRKNFPWTSYAVPKTGQSISRYLARPSRIRGDDS